MKLIRIHYRSAVFLGALALVVQLISGILQLIVKTKFPEIFTAQGIPVASITPLTVLVQVPLIGAIFGYLFGIFVICIYNLTARYGFVFSGETTSDEKPKTKKKKKK